MQCRAHATFTQTGFFMVFATKCHQLVPEHVAVVMKLKGNVNLVCQDETGGATILYAQRCYIKGSPHQPTTPKASLHIWIGCKGSMKKLVTTWNKNEFVRECFAVGER